MNLFIDTNIYLTFYDFSKDDIEELRKLEVAIKAKKINLFVPQQTIGEYRRNREAKIASSLKVMSVQSIPDSFPRFVHDYQEYSKLKSLIGDYIRTKDQLLQKVHVDIENKSLDADKLILNLFNLAKVIPTTSELLNQARRRYEIGNPPGKDGSYGDSINWESLLSAVPDEEGLHLIAKDKDYISKISAEAISDFLQEEWNQEKNSQIFFYTTLSAFFSQHFPNIKLASELEHEPYVQILVESPSFATTHAVLRRLSLFTNFSDNEVCKMLQAGLDNDQILLIIEDDDVKTFFSHLIEKYQEIIPEELLAKYSSFYKPDIKIDKTCGYCASGEVKFGEVCPNCEEIYTIF
ncbi:MAG: PIN domain-containing protein [Patescibacteria group bacterium]